MRRRAPAFSNEETSVSVDTPLPTLNLPDGVSCWSGDALERRWRMAVTGESVAQKAPAANHTPAPHLSDAALDDALRQVKALYQSINILGLRSQRAQGIGSVLTSVRRLREEPSFRLYLLSSEGHAVGLLKVGVKKLFIEHPRTHTLVEVDPLCILDFYVAEECQRRGFGRVLLQAMLQDSSTCAGTSSRGGALLPMAHIAIDRPSPKFLALLRKYYDCQAPRVQVNNFVVFDRFFEDTTVTERGQLRRRSAAAESTPNHSRHNSSNNHSYSSTRQSTQRTNTHLSVHNSSGVSGSLCDTHPAAHNLARPRCEASSALPHMLLHAGVEQTHTHASSMTAHSRSNTGSHTTLSSSVVSPLSSPLGMSGAAVAAAAPVELHVSPAASHLSTCSKQDSHQTSSRTSVGVNSSSAASKQACSLQCPL